MRGVAGKEHAAFAKGLGDALMRHIKIAMHDLVGLRRRKERLHARLHASVAQYLLFALRRIGRINRAPKRWRTVGRDLEAIAPGAGVGEIAAVAVAALGFEIVRSGEDDAALRPGKAFERDAGTPAHGAAAAVSANEIAASVRRYARWSAHLHRDRMRGLRHVDHFVIEQDLDIRIGAQALQKKLCGFELFALHDERMPRVIFENGMVELGDQLLAWAVPKLKDRRDEADARHVTVETVLAQQIERRRMRRRGARVGLQAAIVVEQPNRHPAPAEKPGAKEADRSAASDQDSAFLIRHARSLLEHDPSRRPVSTFRDHALANGARRRDTAGASA